MATYRTHHMCQPQAAGRAVRSRRRAWLWAAVWWGLCASASAQDTVRALGTVEVSGTRQPPTLRTAVPTQVVDAQRLEADGALLLSDAVRSMAGVSLKDYGGVGGMKTVSARGLGTQFSTVTIDGVAVSDAQNGQVDLGRYLVGNAAYVGFSQGQQQRALMSARAYAAGNVLELESAVPRFFAAERTNLKVGMELGSFGMMNPTGLWEQRWGRGLTSSVWVSWLTSQGDYPFTLYYTPDRQGATGSERRQHSAMSMGTADASVHYAPDSSNRLTAKVHYLRGWHELPGPVHLYRQAVSAESTHEEVAFVQGKWVHEGRRWRGQLMGKWQHTADRYEDSAAYTLTGYQRNDYRQREAYISGSAAWDAAEWAELRCAADGSLSHLGSNLGQRNDVGRRELLAAAALRLHHRGWELQGSLSATRVVDEVADLDTLPTFGRLSPYAAAAYTFGGGRATVRYFYKETYRAPNFSELYFFTLPRALRPECARQHNVGITYTDGRWSATADAYLNHVRDKILAIPTQNMFLWSMENLGRALIVGGDLTVAAQLGPVECRAHYSLQHAEDRTDASSRTYGHQIAYTPRHTGGGSLRWENRVVNLGASAMVVGRRYYRMQNTPESLMPAYADLGLTADRRIDLRWGTMRVQVQVLNLLGVQYEVVHAYPMMGRNYRLRVMYEF